MENIFRHLKKEERNGKVIQGLKTFFNEDLRSEHLIERLKAFSKDITIHDISSNSDPINNQPNKEWYLYRRLSLIAIKQYIQDFPFLMHTPSSLRSVFGLPTRKDRKRGKYSGKELIEDAIADTNDLNEIINYESVLELKDCLEEVVNDFPQYSPECRNLLQYLEQNLSRNSLKETMVPEISTHSLSSLEKSKKFLEKKGFSNVIHEEEPEYPYGDEDAILTPDFLCEIWDNPVWFELKEWTNFNIFLSPVKQLLTYLKANIETKKSNEKSFIGILVENEVDFFKFLYKFDKKVSFKRLRDEIYPNIENTNQSSEKIHNMRKIYYKIGRILIEKYNLQIKAESLFIGLMAELINKELGMINTEVEAGIVILNLIKELEAQEEELLIIPVTELEKIKHPPKHNFIIFLGILDN